ncbi:hypothetical protein B0H11DRAFT_2321786 [Mycena galericulata]|nr:hypothetical protein B0H11DRAFT_2321786 [Mycena galericulata]
MNEEWERERKGMNIGEVKVRQAGKKGKRHELPLRIWGSENRFVRRDARRIERGDKPRRDIGALKAHDDRVWVRAPTRTVVVHDAARRREHSLDDHGGLPADVLAPVDRPKACLLVGRDREWETGAGAGGEGNRGRRMHERNGRGRMHEGTGAGAGTNERRDEAGAGGGTKETGVDAGAKEMGSGAGGTAAESGAWASTPGGETAAGTAEVSTRLPSRVDSSCIGRGAWRAGSASAGDLQFGMYLSTALAARLVPEDTTKPTASTARSTPAAPQKAQWSGSWGKNDGGW